MTHRPPGRAARRLISPSVHNFKKAMKNIFAPQKTLWSERINKFCSRAAGKIKRAVFLGFGFVSAQLQGFTNLSLRRSLAKTPKILAPRGYRIYLNALGAIGAKNHPFAHFDLNQSFRANPSGNFS